MANFKVVSGALNVRTGPSLSERTVGTIQAGDVVAQLPASAFEPPANGIVTEVTARHPVVRTWLKVDDGEIEGWTSLKNLTEQPDGNFLVTVDSNVRLEPFIPSATAPSNFVGSEPLKSGTVLPAGAMVAETSVTTGARQWVRLDLGSAPSGWASLLLLTPTTGNTSLSPTKYKVTANKLHVRSEPSLDSLAIGEIAMGTVLLEGTIATEENRRWMRIASPLAGFVSMKFLSKVSTVAASTGAPRWYEIARGEEGVKEFSGARDNPEVIKYLKSCSELGASAQRNDETFWCSAFVNWCVEQAGFEGTESALARSWMNWGRPTSNPTEGCIVVLSRGTPPSGHVGFFVKQDPGPGGLLYLLGGNQGDSVNVTAYAKSRILRNGFRVSR